MRFLFDIFCKNSSTCLIVIIHLSFSLASFNLKLSPYFPTPLTYQKKVYMCGNKHGVVFPSQTVFQRIGFQAKLLSVTVLKCVHHL